MAVWKNGTVLVHENGIAEPKDAMEALRPPIVSFLLALWLFLFWPIISAENESSSLSPTANDTDFVRSSCSTTLYPDLCYNSLARYANDIQQDPARLARVAIAVSLVKTRNMAVYVSNLSRSADYGGNPRAASALQDCFTNFDDAADQISGSFRQMNMISEGESFRFQMSNVQTWMSAALTDQDTCTDGFEEVGDVPVKRSVCDRAEKVKRHTSNALALVNSYAARKATPP